MPYYLKQSRFSIAVWLFFKLLAIVYFSAFVSYLIQMPGLIGENGILPAKIFLEASKYNLGESAYYNLPTLAWISSGDFFIYLLCLLGVLFSLLLLAGVLTLHSAILLYILYLSLVVIGQSFMSFQWDGLLLETGLLAILIAPRKLTYSLYKKTEPTKILLLLFWFLLFRMMVSSGLGKILSGDPSWANLTALNYHYFTQPLPTPFAWYANLLPVFIQKISVVIMLFIEIFVPFFFFAPRLLRHYAGILTIGLQLIIMFTGNYTYFNILSIALCLLLFDNRFLISILPKGVTKKIKEEDVKQRTAYPKFKKVVVYTLSATILFFGALQFYVTIFGFWSLPLTMQKVVREISPLRSFNRYGLFTVMTTARPEIIIEGSLDGKNWKEYKFKYKPSDLDRSLPIVAPYQPRLDWQMWFAALSNYQNNPWFIKLIEKLSEGSPEVLGLLDNNPFPENPPVFFRAILYDYTFTNYKERKKTGNIWKREPIGYYLPEVKVK